MRNVCITRLSSKKGHAFSHQSTEPPTYKIAKKRDTSQKNNSLAEVPKKSRCAKPRLKMRVAEVDEVAVPPPIPVGERKRKERSEGKEAIQYPRSCPHCGLSFPNSSRYHKHVYFHTAERKFKCDHPGCDKSYKRKVDLDDHKAVHLAVKPFRCIVTACCNKTFARKGDLMKHVKCAHNGLTCEACGLRFRKKCKLQKHWQLVHPNLAAGQKVAPGICPDCGKEFSNRSHLLTHIESHRKTEKNVKKHKCKDCDEAFEEFLDMVRHRKAKHPKTFTCEQCGLVYKRLEQLKRHQDATHNEMLVRCPQDGCEFTFMSRPAMKLHFRVVHLQMKDFKCQHCDKAFAYKGVLRRHIQKIHKVEPTAEELEPKKVDPVVESPVVDPVPVPVRPAAA